MSAEIVGDCIEGIILRESGELRVRVKVADNGRAQSFCPCFINRQQGLICAHVVALAILILQRRSDPAREQRYQEEQRHARAMAARLAEHTLLRNRRGIAAQVRLFLEPDWLASFRGDAVEIECALLVEGQFLPVRALTDERGYALSHADDNLLLVLEDICEGSPPARFSVNKPDFLNILELLRGRAIFLTDGSQIEIGEEPRAGAVHLDMDQQSGELVLSIQVDGAKPQGEVVSAYLVHNKQSWLVDDKQVWPLHSTLPLPYHGLYEEPVRIPRHDILRFLANEVPQLEKLAPVVYDIDPSLFMVRPGKPTMRLVVRGSPASLSAQLFADYGDKMVPAESTAPGDTIAIPDPDDLLNFCGRNFELENQALLRLNRVGFRGTPGNCLQPICGERQVLNFLGSDLPALRRWGWKVTLEGRVAPFYEELPVITPVVTIERGDTDTWFEIGMDFECQQDPTITPSEVQRAINLGHSFIKRGERALLLDRSAVSDMRDVFEDCNARDGRKPGTFRLDGVYGSFVQSSLAAIDGIDVEEPAAWRDQAQQQNRDVALEAVPLGDSTLERILRDYQKQGVYWLRFLEKSGFNGLLADEMGLGKTLQTLAWLQMARVNNQRGKLPALIVCPTSLVENWHREAGKFVPEMRCLVLSGPERSRSFAEIPQADLVITSYALLRRDLESCYEQRHFSVAVLDEAQHIKNRSTQNAQAAKKLKAEAKLVLTGTPLENSVVDIWSIMDFLMPGYLGNYQTFQGSYEMPIAAGGDYGARAQLKLRRKLQPFLLRRLKREVAKDLPGKIERISYCTLTPDQQRVYDALLNDSRRKIGEMVQEKGFNHCRMQILALLMRLRQVCCHLELLPADERPAKVRAPSAKLEQFLDLLDEAIDGGHRILVFSQFVTMLHILRTELEQRGIDYCYLDGSTKDRLAQVHRFNSTPTIPLFLISLKAGGTGLTLTGADMVVHFDPWWNPAVEDQATDRAHRIGQKRVVYSVKLIAEQTIEEKVLALQKKKQAVIDATIGASDADVIKKLTWDDVRSLFDL